MGGNRSQGKTKRSRTDQEKLELFVAKVNELRQTTIARNGFLVSHKVHYESRQSLQHSLTQPEESDLKEYLLSVILYQRKRMYF